VFVLLPALLAGVAHAQAAAPTVPFTPPTSLTIYNQDFAVARTTIDLDLKAGATDVLTTQVTRALEPDSVILRDASGKHPFRIAEQNYDSSVINQFTLLKKFEGKVLDFLPPAWPMQGQGTPLPIIHGRLIRAGGDNGAQPLVEVDGKMQFQLPGVPLFPASTDGLLLKPTLKWKIESARPARFPAELAYITNGISWEATYNIVAPETTDVTAAEHADLSGWVTIKNDTGTDFPQAGIKLMAGDVAKIQNLRNRGIMGGYAMSEAMAVNVAPSVTQKAFDDFHLYDLHRTVSLLDGEIKQVQFIDVPNITLKRDYQYDGAGNIPNGYNNYGNVNTNRGFGIGDNTAVQAREEFKNSEANHLGMPLPAGRIRFYRRDGDGQMEFVGEGTIRHTPAEETVAVTTGNAFDVKGHRTQTTFHINNQTRDLDEGFEIKLTNQKKQPVQVMVIERLYRGENWHILSSSLPYTSIDSHTVQFAVDVPAGGDATLDYAVHYSW
jgi:hypothetical protein